MGRSPKHGRSFDGFDEQILAPYACGMSTRDTQRHLRELYGVDVSDGLISEVTGSRLHGRWKGSKPCSAERHRPRCPTARRRPRGATHRDGAKAQACGGADRSRRT